MEHQREWSTRVTVRIGQQIAALRGREHSRMTAQALADRCTDLGLPMDRAVIAKLEKGHRQNVTVAELMVLARALEVSPVELVFPLGHQEKIEILPTEHADAWAAAKWFTGDAGFPGEDPMTWTLVREFREHDQALLELREERLTVHDQQLAEAPLYKQLSAVLGSRPEDVDPSEIENPELFRSWRAWRKLADEVEQGQKQAEKLRFDVVMRRRRLRKRGIVPPPLDAEFADLDDGETEEES